MSGVRPTASGASYSLPFNSGTPRNGGDEARSNPPSGTTVTHTPQPFSNNAKHVYCSHLIKMAAIAEEQQTPKKVDVVGEMWKVFSYYS